MNDKTSTQQRIFGGNFKVNILSLANSVDIQWLIGADWIALEIFNVVSVILIFLPAHALN